MSSCFSSWPLEGADFSMGMLRSCEASAGRFGAEMVRIPSAESDDRNVNGSMF